MDEQIQEPDPGPNSAVSDPTKSTNQAIDSSSPKKPGRVLSIFVIAFVVIWLVFQTSMAVRSTSLYQTDVVQMAHSQALTSEDLTEVAQLSELFYGTRHSYSGYCSDPSTVSLLQDAAQRSTDANGKYTCNDGTFGFAATVKVDTGYVCVDGSSPDNVVATHRDAMNIPSDIGTSVSCP